MSGFFTRKEVESKSRPNGKVLSCTSCGLYKSAENARMSPYGEFKKKIMVIGESPDEHSDDKGKPFQGKTGRKLQRVLAELKIDLFEDCICLNAVNCRTPDDRAPKTHEMDCCRSVKVLKAIEKYKPKVIILLGTPAVYSVIGHRWKKDLGTINKWRGFCIPDQDLQAWICPTFHPSFVENDNEGIIETIWKQDLEQAISKVDIPLPENHIPRINYLESLDILKQIPMQTTRVVIDFETTGIKPHAHGHKVICASVAISPDNVFVFMIPKSRQERTPFLQLLDNSMIEKAGHNIKFEDIWSKVRLRTETHSWFWDSMLAAHIIDNRPGICNLQFQVYVNFGVVDFKSETDSWLESIEDSGNAFNKIEELVSTENGKKLLMERNAMDSIWEYRLMEKQMKEMNINDLPF